MPLLQVNNLEIAFRTGGAPKQVLFGINFHAEAGQTLAIVGESGSGKTVATLSLLGLIPRRSLAYIKGEALFTRRNGTVIDLLKASEEELRSIRGGEIGMIFQEPMSALNPAYTCGNQLLENIRLHQRLRGQAALDSATALLEEVELTDTERMMQSYPHQLSGGQRQRVMIAMALAGNPQLLIADEPTTALDVSVQASIIQTLKKLQAQRHMSIIFISHDLGLVKRLAQDILVLYKGAQVEYGPGEQVFNHPQHAYTKALLYCRPSTHNPRELLPTVSQVIQDPDFKPAQAPERVISPEALVEIKDLEVVYYRRQGLLGKKQAYHALHRISFTIRKGETLGLIGESGSGKSTLGRTLLRLVPAESGEVHFANPATGKGFRRMAQIIFQDPFSSLNPRLTIGQAIKEPMEVHGLLTGNTARRQRTLELLDEVGLDASYYHRYPHELSGGQRQRVSIARCLALQPDFIVCDESVSALDVSVQAQILNLLRSLQARYNLTYLFITHDLGVVRYMCDRVVVLRQGRMEELAPADELFSAPKSSYTRQLLAAAT